MFDSRHVLSNSPLSRAALRLGLRANLCSSRRAGVAVQGGHLACTAQHLHTRTHRHLHQLLHSSALIGTCTTTSACTTHPHLHFRSHPYPHLHWNASVYSTCDLHSTWSPSHESPTIPSGPRSLLGQVVATALHPIPPPLVIVGTDSRYSCSTGPGGAIWCMWRES